MQTFFTADTHFNHGNILAYDSLPFKDVQEMNEAIVERWNAVVAPGDLVYHLGDVGFRDVGSILARLNGRRILIRGNHDRGRTSFWKANFEAVMDDYLFVGDDVALYLSHRRTVPWPGRANGVFHLHGHSHGNAPVIDGALDVGSKCWRHYPLSLGEITTLLL